MSGRARRRFRPRRRCARTRRRPPWTAPDTHSRRSRPCRALPNGASRYGTVARCLHWLVAALVVVAFLLGEQTEDLEGAARLETLGIHVAIGLFVLAVGLLRLASRWHDRAPPLPSTLPGRERVGAAGLLILAVALPLAGLLAVLTGESGLEVHGAGTLAPRGRSPLAQAAGAAVHGFLGKLLLALFLLHLGAVIWHGIERRADVLARMIPLGLE